MRDIAVAGIVVAKVNVCLVLRPSGASGQSLLMDVQELVVQYPLGSDLHLCRMTDYGSRDLPLPLQMIKQFIMKDLCGTIQRLRFGLRRRNHAARENEQ